jgi:hypothetical protein
MANSVWAAGVILAGLFSTACAPTGSEDGDRDRTSKMDAKATAPEAKPDDDEEGIATNQKAPVNETDQMMLQQAETACKTADYREFFDAFISSKFVQQKYTASTIEYTLRNPDGKLLSSRKIAAWDYRDFPIFMLDHYRKPTKPLTAGDKKEYVILELNVGRESDLHFEWARVRFDGKSEGGDDLGSPLDMDGVPYDPDGFKDGQLMFFPTSDCWVLVADTRYQRQ